MEIQDFAGEYVCSNCNTEFEAPHHCGRGMIVINDNGFFMWRCWKGEHAPCCGKPSVISLDTCCDSQDIVPKNTKEQLKSL